ILDYSIHLLDEIKHLRSATNYPHWLPTPFNGHLLSGFDLTNIYSYRCSGGPRFSAGVPGRHERHSGPDDTNPANNRSCCHEKTTSALIHVAMIHTGFLPLRSARPQLMTAVTANLDSSGPGIAAHILMKLACRYKNVPTRQSVKPQR